MTDNSCGAVECSNHCGGDFDFDTCPHAMRHRDAHTSGWSPMNDAPRDGRDLLLFHRIHSAISGRFVPGMWSEDTPVSPREYTGAIWVLGDDLGQEEVEELPNGYHDGNVIAWRPAIAPPGTALLPTPRADSDSENSAEVEGFGRAEAGASPSGGDGWLPMATRPPERSAGDHIARAVPRLMESRS